MTTVFITSYQASGNGGNTTPTESMSLNFTKASFEYGK
jgi:type VI protein secretion system component Hcp